MSTLLNTFFSIFLSAQAGAPSMLETDEGFIEYEIKEGGETVVLFDGGALSAMSGWDPIWDSLPTDITAIRFSRLGEGNSDPCSGQRSALDYVNEVEQLLFELGVEPPIVYVSQSFGGTTAMNFAAHHQGDVAALLMIDPANPRDVDIITQLDPSGGHEEIEAIKKNDYAMGEGKWCFLDLMWDKSKSPGYVDIGDIPVTLIAGVKVPEQPASVFESAEGRRLWGQYQSDWVNQFPQGKAVVTENSGHMVQQDEPELVLAELVNLLDELKVANKSMQQATTLAVESLDNQSVTRALEADQASRSQENIEQGKFPKFADEMSRRLLVFTALSRGELVTANDFYHAAVILQHTNLERVGDTLRSMGNENHLLAHFLARRARELEHSNSNWLLVATYNRYLENSTHDFDRYALKLEDGIVKPRNQQVTDEDRIAVGLTPVSNIVDGL